MRPEVAYQSLIARRRFVVVDVETTPSDGGVRIISIGLVPHIPDQATRPSKRAVKAAQPVGERSWLLDPGAPIENVHIHGITDADVAGKPTFAAVADELTDKITGLGLPGESVFVAHYATSDLRALKLEYDRVGKTMPAMLVLDTYQVARLLDAQTEGEGYGLRALLALWDKTPTKHHDALADAQDTAFLLDKLLRLASQRGHNNLDLLIAAASPTRQTTEDYNAGDPARSDGGSARFTHIDRPAAHNKAHQKLPANANAAQVTHWLTTTRACIDLRCPQMLAQIEDLKARPDQYDRILRALMTDLGRASRAGQVVQANTILMAYTAVLASSLRTRGRKSLAHEKYVIATHTKLAKLVKVSTRCPIDPAVRSDACPGCRSRQGCAHDTWDTPFGALSIVASYKKDALTKWLGPGGLLTRSARSNDRLAALQADFIIEQVEVLDRLGAGTPLAEEAVALALYTPTVGRIVAQQHALAGDISAALVDVETFLSLRDGNTAPAWDQLEDYRHTLLAQAAQAQRLRPSRPYRPGHTAPKRPTNRRFTRPARTSEVIAEEAAAHGAAPADLVFTSPTS